MTITPGPPSRPSDAARARQKLTLLASELPRARTAAAAWRNGVAALMVGILGFGLIRGRSDISQLASPWSVLAGALLLAALGAGVASAFLLLRAAHGRVTPIPAASLHTGPAADHIAALAALADLRRGLVTGLASLTFLVAAIGATWYGPPAAEPFVLVETSEGTVCGSGLTSTGVALTVIVGKGMVREIPISSVRSVKAVKSCP